jgi:hypothetical protein
MDRLTVTELIERLRRMPQSAEVITEGCDCYGDAVDVEFDESDNTVLIRRTKAEVEQLII